MLKELSIELMTALFQIMFSLSTGLSNTELLDDSLVPLINNLSTAIKPIGYALLAVFAVLELVQLSERMGNINGFAGTGLVIEVLIKVILCKVVVDNSTEICQFIISIADEASRGISHENPEIITRSEVAEYINRIYPSGFFDILGQLAMFLIIIVFCFLSVICMGMVYVVFIARVIEMYAYSAISPIPLSTCLSKNLNVAPNFIKNVLAVGLQGTLLILLVKIFNILILNELGGIINGTVTTGIFSFIISGSSSFAQCLQLLITTVFMSILMLVCTFQTQKWAKSICHAM
ncbi:MAG: hypothetical protein UGF89_01420 [Acutalibacteraceae bacterium]|nr:hypothetical protein [Acutalibacteraceae bacterium]